MRGSMNWRRKWLFRHSCCSGGLFSAGGGKQNPIATSAKMIKSRLLEIVVVFVRSSCDSNNKIRGKRSRICGINGSLVGIRSRIIHKSSIILSRSGIPTSVLNLHHDRLFSSVASHCRVLNSFHFQGCEETGKRVRGISGSPKNKAAWCWKNGSDRKAAVDVVFLQQERSLSFSPSSYCTGSWSLTTAQALSNTRKTSPDADADDRRHPHIGTKARPRLGDLHLYLHCTSSTIVTEAKMMISWWSWSRMSSRRWWWRCPPKDDDGRESSSNWIKYYNNEAIARGRPQ